MDPKTVKLTNTQKIKPLLKAINHEIPWQVILVITVALTALIVIPANIAVLLEPGIFDFIDRIIIGTVCAGVTLLLCGFTSMVIEDKFKPLIRHINEQYMKEKLVVQKQVLDDVIEDEILK